MDKFIEIRDRYINKYGLRPAKTNFICDIEEKLSIKLPFEFKEILKYFDGYDIEYYYLFAFDCEISDTNVYSETLRLRNVINLPKNWLFISEPPESAIFMDCSKSDFGEIIWIDSHDVYNLENQNFVSKVDRWASFTEFLKFILDKQEEE